MSSAQQTQPPTLVGAWQWCATARSTQHPSRITRESDASMPHSTTLLLTLAKTTHSFMHLPVLPNHRSCRRGAGERIRDVRQEGCSGEEDQQDRSASSKGRQEPVCAVTWRPCSQRHHSARGIERVLWLSVRLKAVSTRRENHRSALQLDCASCAGHSSACNGSVVQVSL
jgi:hypothetical protein